MNENERETTRLYGYYEEGRGYQMKSGLARKIPPRQGGMRCMFLFAAKKEPKNRRRFRRGGRTAKRGLRAPLETPGQECGQVNH